MKYRNVSILSPVDLVAASGTKVINIHVKDIISRITLYWQVTMHEDGMNGYQHLDITKIELVDGSDLLHSLDGGQNQALCIYDRKCPTMNVGLHINGVEDVAHFGIDFGRWLLDPVLAFDPTKFSNPQLKITYDEDKSDTLAGGGELEVWADCFDEKIVTPVGFLMSKEIWNAAKPTAGYEYVALPTDYPIRKMLLQPYYAATAPYGIVDEARLDEDNEKRIPFDWNLEAYHYIRRTIDHAIQEDIAGQGDIDGEKLYTTPTNYWATLVANTQDGAGIAWYDRFGKGGYFLVRLSVSTSYAGIVKGWLPNHCFQFPFGNQEDMDDWYDVTRVGNLRLRLKAGAGGANGTVGVILQQLRRY